MKEDRYTPGDRPDEWVCRDCPPSTGGRVINQTVHDAWHDAPGGPASDPLGR